MSQYFQELCVGQSMFCSVLVCNPKHPNSVLVLRRCWKFFIPNGSNLSPFSKREMGQTGNVGWKLSKLTKGTKVGLRECGMQDTETYIKWWICNNLFF